jgi:hypothetical protein
MRRLTSTNAEVILEVSPDGRLLAASDTIDHLLGWDLRRCAAFHLLQRQGGGGSA